VIGVATMASLSAHDFSADDKQLFRAMAQRATSLVVQAQLVASHTRALEALEHGDAFLLLDRGWRIVLVNESQERLSRRPRGETLGRVFWEVWPETAAPGTRYWAEYHRCMEDRVPVAFEEYFAPLDLWTAVTAYPTRDGIAIFFRDVSARRRIEAERDEAAALLDLLIATAPIGLAFYDASLRFVRINDALAEVNGVPVDETIGRTVHEVVPAIAPAIERFVRTVMETGMPVRDVESTGPAREGAPTRHWAASYYPVRNRAGEVFLCGAVVVDVTERRGREEELRLQHWELDRLLAITPDFVCVAGIDGRFRRVNNAFAALLGVAEEELVDAPFMEFVHPDDRRATEDEVRRLAEGGSTSGVEIRFRRADGAYRWVSWNATADVPSQIFVAAGRDVTEARLRSEFEGHLIGIVSHDLKSPLQAILVSCDVLLRRGGLDERPLKAVRLIRASAGRATRMVNDLLDFTRARVGTGIPIAPRPTDLAEVARSVLAEVQPTFPGRDVRLDAAEPCHGEWDADRLAQVITNLVVNGLKYGDEAAPVAVRVRCNGELATLEVHNEGTPIRPELQAQLFEPYRRGSKEGGGSGSVGLGLYITREIVRAHGGTIRCRSTAEEGTTFTVQVPLRVPDEGTVA
jgi:PAS domain S-box-containing protein